MATVPGLSLSTHIYIMSGTLRRFFSDDLRDLLGLCGQIKSNRYVGL